VHKATIARAVAHAVGGAPGSWGEITHKPKAVVKLVEPLNRALGGEMLLFCHEAGPCTYGLHRKRLVLDRDCAVVAPSLIPRKPGERIRTDRRDAANLAQAVRSGDLTAVWVTDAKQEAMRNLMRASDDMKGQERKAHQELDAFVLRHDRPRPATGVQLRSNEN